MWRVFILALGLVTLSAQAKVNNFSNKPFAIQLFKENPGYGLSFDPTSDVEADYNLSPNTSSLDGFQISYKDLISLAIATRRKESDQSILEKGETKYTDYRFAFAKKSFYFRTSFQRYQGFYVDNSEEIDTTIGEGDPRIQEPDFISQTINLGFFYVFSPNEFSLAAALNQTARQEDSGGSLLLGVTLNDAQIENPTTIIPSSLSSQYGVDAGMTQAQFTAISFTLGGGYTLVFLKKFFLTGAVLFGSGQESRRYSVSGTVKTGVTKSLKTDFLWALGFSDENLFFGVTNLSDSTSHVTESMRVGVNLSAFRMYIGLRF